MTTPIDPHAWFREHLDAFVAGGLPAEERQAIESHAAVCAACDAALTEARQADETMRKLFAPIAPSPDFEENLLMNLRTATAPRPLLHPAVVRAATGIAAAVMLGGFGLIGNRVLKDGKFPQLSLPNISIPQMAWLPGADAEKVRASSNLKQIGKGLPLYVNDDLSDSISNDAPTTQPVLRFQKSGGIWNERGGRQLSETASLHGEQPALQLPEQLAQNVEAKLHAGLSGTIGKPVEFGLQTGREPEVTHLERALHVPDGGAPAGGKPLAADSNGRDMTMAWNFQGGTMYGAEGRRTGAGAAPSGGPSDTVATGIATNAGDVNGIAQLGTKGLGYQNSAGTTNYYAFANAANTSKAPEALYFKPSEAKPAFGIERDADQKQLPALAVKLRDGEELEVKENKGIALGDLSGKSSSKPEILGRELDRLKTVDEKAEQLVAQNRGDGKPEPRQFAEGADPAAQPKPDQAPKIADNVPPPVQQQIQRKIIRNGQMEFEVDSFDSAFMQINKIVAEEGGYVTSTDSEKLSNGKVKGTVTVRVPPEHLDVLVLKLRGLGDLKNQKIAAQDITKQYTDLESGLRAARTMEERLLDIIKNGKGEVKDLVEAEKQLGIYREKIEQITGELRYYENLVSLSTLNVTLFERDIKAPTAAFETEEVQAGIEVEDVEKARADALKAIDDAKGRVIESSLKKLDAGQLTASIVAELTPEASGPFTDRLKQLGRVARLEAERKQTTTGGVGAPTPVVKMERKATRFNISLYNLANIAPRETVNMTLAAPDVETAYKAILAAMNAPENPADAGVLGRIVSSTLNSQKSDQTSGAISLEVKSDKAAAIEAIIRGAGEVLHVAISENPDANNVTRAKRGYSLSLVSIAQVPPRETQTLQVAAKSVPDTYKKLLAALQSDKNPSRILSSQLNEQDRQNITAQVDAEVPRASVGAIEAVLTGVESDVYSRNASRANDTQNTLDTKVRLSISLLAADRLQPRETTAIAVEVGDVEKSLLDAISTAETSGGRVVERLMSKQQNGRVAAHAVVDVPLTTAPATLDKLRNLGTVRVVESSKNPQVPEGPLARARFDLNLGNAAPIVSPEDTVGARLSQGLRTSLNGLTFSLMLIVIGICLIGPFALVIWAGWKFLRRGKKKVATA